MIGYCTHLGHWYVDYDDRLPWFGLPMLRFFLCITAISIRDTDMLVALIDYLALFSIVTLILSCLFWPLHMHTLAIVYHSAWHVDYLTCILFWSSLSMMFYITIRLDCRILAYLVCTWVIYPALPDYMMHDCPPSAWLHVACLCGSHFYPLTSKSLGLDHSFHLSSHYCKCETFCVLALWPSQRLGVGSSDGLYRCTGAFWRRATLGCRLESDHWRPV